MRHLKRIVSFFAFLMILFYSNVSNATIKDILVFDGILADTTDMDRSTIWYSSSYIGSWAEGDCRKKIDITKVVRDTIIGDRLSRIIGVTTGGIYLPESEIAIYSKDGKMYFYEDNEWRLLYDFTADVGDTVTYYVSKKYPYYESIAVPSLFDQELINDNPYQLVVKGIDSIYDNSGTPFKRFLTENIYNLYGHFMGYIISDIGSRAKLFGNTGIIIPPQCNPAEEGTGLRCYSDDEVSIKFTEGECDKLVSATDLKLSGITIYPNPAHDIIYITNPAENKLSHVDIHDIAGKYIGQTMIENNQFDIQSLLSGVYMVKIYEGKNLIMHQKIIKL